MPDRADAALPADRFARVDETPDAAFYAAPRFVRHIDEAAIAAVTEAIRRHVPPGADVLDLMSSWVSHLPPATELPLGRVVGLGLNADELRANPRLDAWVVRDLNAPPAGEPPLPFPDRSFDAVLITVSVQYLTDPVGTFRDVARVLRPGGVLLVSFSDRMFPTKATRVWQETPPASRGALVAHAVALAGGFRPARVETAIPPRHPFGAGDPLWLVVADRRDDTPRQGSANDS